MKQIMEPVSKYDDLFSKKTAQRLGRTLAARAEAHVARQRENFERASKWTEAAQAPLVQKIGSENLARAQKGMVKELTAIEHAKFPAAENAGTSPPDAKGHVDGRFPLIPSPHSCVSSVGPYNSWGNQEGGGAGTATLLNGPGARNLGGQVRYGGGGSGHVWGGSGCWFNANPSQSARLRIDFLSNAFCYLGPPLIGYSSGHIRLFGAVWGVNANRWVDFGGRGVDLVSAALVAAWSTDYENTRIEMPFDATAGGAFYCFGWFSVWGGAGGLAACNVDLATIMNPLTVCIP